MPGKAEEIMPSLLRTYKGVGVLVAISGVSAPPHTHMFAMANVLRDFEAVNDKS